MSELEKVKTQVYSCQRCNVCRTKYNWGEKVFRVCPAGEHSAGFWTSFPPGRNQTALEILEGTLAITEAPVEGIFECTLCANCRVKCGAIDVRTGKPLIDTASIVKALRADMFAAGVKIPLGATMMGEAVEKTHNVFGAPAEEITDWLTPDIKVATSADTVYFPGCLAAYRAPEIAQATARILNKAGIKFSLLNEEEYCCGSPLIMTGQLSLAREVAQHNFDLLKGKRVITSCAGCHRCFKAEYPKLMGKEYQINAVHMIELLPELISSGKIKFKAKKAGAREKVTYHDPCELGRELGLYDQPRQVIQSIPGLELVEMTRNRDNGWCCGAGGALKAFKYDMAVEIAANDKIPEALASGAKRIISACPACKQNINDGIKATGAKLTAIDITELVAEVLA